MRVRLGLAAASIELPSELSAAEQVPTEDVTAPVEPAADNSDGSSMEAAAKPKRTRKKAAAPAQETAEAPAKVAE